MCICFLHGSRRVRSQVSNSGRKTTDGFQQSKEGKTKNPLYEHLSFSASTGLGEKEKSRSDRTEVKKGSLMKREAYPGFHRRIGYFQETAINSTKKE